MTLVLTILQMLCAIALIISLFAAIQQKRGLSGSIAGGAETFFGKKKGMDEMLAKCSIAASALFLLLTLLLAMF